MRRAPALLIAGALVLGSPLLMASSCDSPHQSSDYGNVNHSPADVVQFPDGFRNIAHKCDGPNMVYSVSSSGSDTLSGGVAIVANDPRCTGATK